MSEMKMINLVRKGTTITAKIPTGFEHNAARYYYSFECNFRTAVEAETIKIFLEDMIGNAIKNIGKNEYERGYKDGRGHAMKTPRIGSSVAYVKLQEIKD